jgi:hypothetical protein
VDWKDVRVLEPGDKADFLEEPFRSHRGGQFGMKNLESDRPIVFEISGEIHGGHSAPAELALEQVAVAESRREGGRHIRDGDGP